ncbi:MAG: MaoC family dehydratase [Alphaproteobacteria bacterium]|nr:MaoC family dehydratase [Alphaproteobacteria bacterium]
MSQSESDPSPHPTATYEIGRTATRDYLFTEQNIAAYSKMAGDTNPLHLDPQFAKNSKFGAVIASAAHSTGVLVSVLADEYSRRGEAVGLGFTFTLRRAVKAGCHTELIWTITGSEVSKKLKGLVISLSGEVRDKTTGQPLVIAEGKLLAHDGDAST